jgi:GTP pyrophosphokinase
LKRLGFDQTSFEHAAHLFGYEKLEDFLVAVGAGDISGPQIAQKMLEVERREQQKMLVQHLIEEPRAVPSQVQIETNGISISGMGGMLVTLAQCCNPMYGDPIVGFITRGRGVTVHRRDCVNIQNSNEPERIVDVSWGKTATEEKYSVPLEIVAYDRDGLLRDISAVVADEKVNMTKVTVSTKQNMAILQLTMEIANFQQLTRILNKMERIQNVIEARRRKMA